MMAVHPNAHLANALEEAVLLHAQTNAHQTLSNAAEIPRKSACYKVTDAMTGAQTSIAIVMINAQAKHAHD